MIIFPKMTGFSQRLRSEIEYIGLNHKEFAAKVGIKKRALDAYLGVQQSMPPADIAVKMASVLGLSVEYLVLGRERQGVTDISEYVRFRDVLDDLLAVSDEELPVVKAMVKAAADLGRKKI